MIPNSSDTAGCDQILKQMMYGERKVREKGKLGRGRERKGENESVGTVTHIYIYIYIYIYI